MPNLTSAYEELADAYHEGVDPDGSGLNDPAFDALVGDIHGQRVAAVACGQGRDARRLADLGARVVGIDASESLLSHARRLEQQNPRGIEFHHDDAQNLGPDFTGSFDGAVCYMALMDIPDLKPTVHSIARILKPGGWFVASIVHPCYKTPAAGELIDHVDGSTRRIVGRYFDEGPFTSPTRLAILPRVAYHRMLSTYLNTFAAAGLPITQMAEPVGDRPVWQTVPGILHFRCQRSPSVLVVDPCEIR
ncbi:class I SAM-dependent methyltransferase [Kribbella antibiotica]|uniref:Class I SAM-dependent methyltransferase n=1 Tax=Kribbella antibiotica TaxID=190195 RepID=A0A4R4ZS18_9ACTN|nr:class I SAM-dependent methyltransferase [Kribbella antibiotica]TDD61170.1 class I SAM-dependent methyltransferase [Kribbella antibiotica]